MINIGFTFFHSTFVGTHSAYNCAVTNHHPKTQQLFRSHLSFWAVLSVIMTCIFTLDPIEQHVGQDWVDWILITYNSTPYEKQIPGFPITAPVTNHLEQTR